MVEAFGNPVTFYQLQDDGKPIKGRGEKMRYEMGKELVILTGNAQLEQLDSSIKGDKSLIWFQHNRWKHLATKVNGLLPYYCLLSYKKKAPTLIARVNNRQWQH